MLQIAICDNEPLHCKELTRYVEHTVQYRQANIRTFQKSKQLLDLIHQQKYAPHIAVIEVCMPDTDGITLAKYINELLPNCQIIFFMYISFWSSSFLKESDRQWSWHYPICRKSTHRSKCKN